MMTHKPNMFVNAMIQLEVGAVILKYSLLSQMLSESNHGGSAASGVRGEGWVGEYYCRRVEAKGFFCMEIRQE